MTNEDNYQKTDALPDGNNVTSRALPREPLIPEEGGYEIIPSDDPRIQEIEEFNRQLRPERYAQLDKDKIKNSQCLK